MQAVCQFCCFGKRQKSKRQGNLKTTHHIHNPPHPLQNSLFGKWSANEEMRQLARKGGIHHTRDPDMSHDLHMYAGSCIKCFPSTEWRSSASIRRKVFPLRKKRGKVTQTFLGPDTIIVDTQCETKLAGITPLKMLWLLKKVLSRLYNTPVQWPQSPPALPLPPCSDWLKQPLLNPFIPHQYIPILVPLGQRALKGAFAAGC